MLEPKEVVITGPDGVDRTFIFSKFTAIAGREIIAKYPISIMPKIGDYKVSEETMLKLMAFVAMPMPNGAPPLKLTTKALVDGHTHDWETLGKIEIGMMEYNCSFFGNGEASNFFESFAAKAIALITKMSMGSSARSSANASQP